MSYLLKTVILLLIGKAYSCSDGFEDVSNSSGCDKTNDCLNITGLCPEGQSCVNFNGSFECVGNDVIKSNKSLTEEIPKFLVAFNSNILEIPVKDQMIMTDQIDNSNLLYGGVKSLRSLEYNLEDNYIVWTDDYGKMWTAPLDTRKDNLLGINGSKLLVSSPFADPFYLSVDWIHNLVYWTDAQNNTIHILNPTTPDLHFIVPAEINGVLSRIVVNPIESFILWAEWSSSFSNFNSKYLIVKAMPDGTDEKVLAQYEGEDIHYSPTALSIDYDLKRIVWINIFTKTLYSIDYNGNDQRIILKSDLISTPYSMDIFDQTIYWLENDEVVKANKLAVDGNQTSVVIKINKRQIINGFKLIHSSLQQRKISNKCVPNQCSNAFICLPLASRFKCVCGYLELAAERCLKRDGQETVSKVLTVVTENSTNTAPAKINSTSLDEIPDGFFTIQHVDIRTAQGGEKKEQSLTGKIAQTETANKDKRTEETTSSQMSDGLDEPSIRPFKINFEDKKQNETEVSFNFFLELKSKIKRLSVFIIFLFVLTMTLVFVSLAFSAFSRRNRGYKVKYAQVVYRRTEEDNFYERCDNSYFN